MNFGIATRFGVVSTQKFIKAVIHVWSRFEWTGSFFFMPSGITKNTDVLVRLSGFKPVSLYSYHLFILLAVKFGLRKRRFNEKNCSRINHHTEESVWRRNSSWFRKARWRDRSSCYFCVPLHRETVRLVRFNCSVRQRTCTCLHSHLQTQSGLVNSIPAFH